MRGVCVAVVQLCSSAEVSTSLRHLDDVLSDLKPGDVDAVFLPENFAALAATNPRAIGDAETYGAGEIKAFVAGKAKGLGPGEPQALNPKFLPGPLASPV